MIDEEKRKERQKRYNSKTKGFSLIYNLQEADEAKRLSDYLEITGQSANKYLKELVKRDLDVKGV